MKTERKAFLIQWSEGDPVLVLARDFSAAIDVFCDEMKEEDITPEEVKSWIESVNLVADYVVSERVNY